MPIVSVSPAYPVQVSGNSARPLLEINHMKSKCRCPYCSTPAELKDAFVIYKRLGFGQVYVCGNYPACDAYVGVHEGTTKPKGSLANAELRGLRQQVHAVFDPVWRSGKYERSELYEAAARTLGLPEFHIGDMRESEAKLFLESKGDLMAAITCYIDAKRKELLSSPSGSNIVSVLRYLFVDSQRRPVKLLSYSSYRGHADSFKYAMSAGLLKKFKAKEGSKVFVALTPLGMNTLNIA